MSNQKDYAIGFIRIKPKWSMQEQKYVDSMLFEGFIYKHNPETGEPQVSGTRKIKTVDPITKAVTEKEVPINPIDFSFTIAISSLTKVIGREAKRCNIYWSPKPRTERY